MKHYVKGNFFWDLIVVIPFLISYLDIPFVRYTLLLRLTRLSPLMTSIEEVLNLEVILYIYNLGSTLNIFRFIKINIFFIINWTFLWMCMALGSSNRI